MSRRRFYERPRHEQAERMFRMFRNMARNSVGSKRYPDAPKSVEEADALAIRWTRKDYPEFRP